tara:strand:+ start:3245 stop:3397 length:153 start_codon:yes stop_codon:yes gene_type:complete
MLKQHLFVNIMMLMQVGAIFSYTSDKSYGLATYWFACLLINFVVTYVLVK